MRKPTSIKAEVQHEQRYNLLIKDRLDYLKRQIKLMQFAMAMMVMAIVLDIALELVL